MNVKSICSEYIARASLNSKGRSAEQMKHVKQSDEEIDEEVWQRFCKVSREVSVTDNFYHGWWLRGKRIYDPEINPKLVPPYLSNEGFIKLKVADTMY